MPTGIYIRTEEHKQKLRNKVPWNKGITGYFTSFKGKKQPKGFGEKVSERMKKNPIKYWLGKKRPEMSGDKNPLCRPEIALKVSNKLKGRKMTEEWKEKIILANKNRHKLVKERIIKEAEELKKQGFRIIPLIDVFPDIIAIKDGKIFAVEVEYGKPNYNKYTDEIRQYFDDIYWIIRKRDKKW